MTFFSSLHETLFGLLKKNGTDTAAAGVAVEVEVANANAGVREEAQAEPQFHANDEMELLETGAAQEEETTEDDVSAGHNGEEARQSPSIDETKLDQQTATTTQQHVVRLHDLPELEEGESLLGNETETSVVALPVDETNVNNDGGEELNSSIAGEATRSETVDDTLPVVRKERTLSEASPGLDIAVAARDGDPSLAAKKSAMVSAVRSVTLASPPLMLSSAATVANARLQDDENKLGVNGEDESSFSRVDITVIHSAFILVFIVVGALVVAIRRSGRDKSFARVATWLFPSGGSAALLHTQRDVRDLLRPFQPNNMLRHLATVWSRARATLRNMVRRQSVFSATTLVGRWRILPVQYCPPRWVESPESGIVGNADESVSLRRPNNAALDSKSSNRKLSGRGFNVAETLEDGKVNKGWTQDWDISPRPPTEQQQQRLFKDGSDVGAGGSGSAGAVKKNDESVAGAGELGVDAEHLQGEEDLMNYFITGSWNKKRGGSRSECRGGGGARHFEPDNSPDEDVERGVRLGLRAEVEADVHCTSRDHLFPGNHSLHFQPILTDAADVQWVISLTPKARHNERWTLLYSTACDGISLSTLFRANQTAGGSGPALMLIRDDGGGIFGAYTSDRWRREKIGRCYGNGEAFVFRVIPQRVRHSWTQANYLFQSGSTASLSLGGGSHFAIWLDGDLHNGTSGTCETFGSETLSSAPEFRIASLEVWGFTALNRASLSSPSSL